MRWGPLTPGASARIECGPKPTGSPSSTWRIWAPDAIDHLLADSLQLERGRLPRSGSVLMEKSAGNPFFFRQLLYAWRPTASWRSIETGVAGRGTDDLGPEAFRPAAVSSIS